MNKIIFKYLLNNFFKTILKVVLIFYCFGVILNLFEEIEFFKPHDVSLLTPLIFTGMYIPSIMIQIFPFIIFVSSLWFLLNIRNNTDLLALKILGYSNFRIFFILAFTTFLIGWIILFFINPITSSMAKYYEKTKSNYSRDIDHLVTFNKNGLWIKENLPSGQRIISADRPEGVKLKSVTIFEFDDEFNLSQKIFAKSANIEKNNWLLNEVKILKVNNVIGEEKEYETYTINTIYTYDKITNLFKNFDTMSFIDIVLNYDELLSKGYNNNFLKQSLNSMLSLPFFLFLMTSIAAILTMGTLRKSHNFKFIVIGLIVCVAVYYFKDLSLAFGKTDRISIELASWAPVIILSIFSSVGILQINEK